MHGSVIRELSYGAIWNNIIYNFFPIFTAESLRYRMNALRKNNRPGYYNELVSLAREWAPMSFNRKINYLVNYGMHLTTDIRNLFEKVYVHDLAVYNASVQFISDNSLIIDENNLIFNNTSVQDNNELDLRTAGIFNTDNVHYKNLDTDLPELTISNNEYNDLNSLNNDIYTVTENTNIAEYIENSSYHESYNDNYDSFLYDGLD